MPLLNPGREEGGVPCRSRLCVCVFACLCVCVILCVYFYLFVCVYACCMDEQAEMQL